MTDTQSFSAVPLHLQRRVLHTVSGTCLWFHLPAPVTVNHTPLSPKHTYEATLNVSPHGILQWADVAPYVHSTGSLCGVIPPPIRHLWYWVKDTDTQSFLNSDGLPAPIFLGSIRQGSTHFHLCVSDSIYSDLDALQCLRLHMLFQEYGSSHVPILRLHRSVSVCSALTLQMDHALRAKNLGKWASLMQQRITFLPYQNHRALREIRRLAYVHHWRICVTPPAFVIYAVFHLDLGILYIRQPHLAPVQRLRKHMTDAAAGTDTASLHSWMQIANQAGWGIAVLEYTSDVWWTVVQERDWWYRLRHWACNDVPPGIHN